MPCSPRQNTIEIVEPALVIYTYNISTKEDWNKCKASLSDIEDSLVYKVRLNKTKPLGLQKLLVVSKQELMRKSTRTSLGT